MENTEEFEDKSCQYVSVKRCTGDFQHFKVPAPVYVYIRQLETAVKHGTQALEVLYPERFGK